MSIKTVTFAKNGHGIDSISINTANNTIYLTCSALPAISGRHYRLAKQGSRLEYRSGSGYVEVPADIKMIS